MVFVPNLSKVTQILSDRINATYMVNLLCSLAWLQINVCMNKGLDTPSPKNLPVCGEETLQARRGR